MAKIVVIVDRFMCNIFMQIKLNEKIDFKKCIPEVSVKYDSHHVLAALDSLVSCNDLYLAQKKYINLKKSS